MKTVIVTLNDHPLELPRGATLADALHAANAAGIPAAMLAPPFAVAVNSGFVARADYLNHMLGPGDRIDVVRPVAGG